MTCKNKLLLEKIKEIAKAKGEQRQKVVALMNKDANKLARRLGIQ